MSIICEERKMNQTEGMVLVWWLCPKAIQKVMKRIEKMSLPDYLVVNLQDHSQGSHRGGDVFGNSSCVCSQGEFKQFIEKSNIDGVVVNPEDFTLLAGLPGIFTFLR